VDAASTGAAAAAVPVDSSIQVDVKLELLLDVEPWARSGMRYPQLVQKRAVARMGCPQFGQVSTIYPFTRSRGRVKLETQIEKNHVMPRSMAETRAPIAVETSLLRFPGRKPTELLPMR